MGEFGVMAYLGVTVGGLILLVLFSQVLYWTVFKKMSLEARCQLSVIVAYLLASLGYGYNSMKWGMTFGDGLITGLVNYALAAALCFAGYYCLAKPKENGSDKKSRD